MNEHTHTHIYFFTWIFRYIDTNTHTRTYIYTFIQYPEFIFHNCISEINLMSLQTCVDVCAQTCKYLHLHMWCRYICTCNIMSIVLFVIVFKVCFSALQLCVSYLHNLSISIHTYILYLRLVPTGMYTFLTIFDH